MVELHIDLCIGDAEDKSNALFARIAVTVLRGCEVCEPLLISLAHVDEALLHVKELAAIA